MMRFIFTALQVALAADIARGASPFVQLSPAPAFYPRLLAGSSGSPALAVVEAPNATSRRLVLLARANASADAPWAPTGAVVASAPVANDADLANGYLLRHSSGAILCAFRHHDGVGSARVFRIQVVASGDGGATWGAALTVTAGPVGVWEPLLNEGARGAIHVYYSAELTNGGEQDIVRQSSSDGGRTWGAVDARIHTPSSRNGMPGIVGLRDGSLFAAFEGFWGPFGWGHFTVNGARSFDGGQTWVQRAVVHAPVVADENAGSPQVAACADGRIAAIFMSSEHNGLGWPDGAHLAVAFAAPDARNASAPLVFSAPVIVPTPGDALWPSFVEDGGERAVWQGAAGDAWLGSAVC